MLRSFSSTSRALRRAEKVLLLEEFLFRQRIIGIYRELFRVIYKSHEKVDLARFVRDEFKMNLKETDLGHRKYLLSIGVSRINEMSKIMGLKIREF